MVTPEEGLRLAAGFIQGDLDSQGGLVRGRVAWEFALQLDVGHGAAFELRVKVWPSTVGALPYRFACSVHAQAPGMGTPYIGNDVAATVKEAVMTAVHNTMYPIRQGQAANLAFHPSWLKPNATYASTPNFQD